MKVKRRLTFFEAICRSLDSNAVYGDKKGRARRSEFWWFALFCFSCEMIIDAVSYYLYEYKDYDEGKLILGTSVVSSYITLAFISCMTRRLHDIGKTGLSLNVSLVFASFLIPLWLFRQFFSMTKLYFLLAVFGGIATVFFIYALMLCMRDSDRAPNIYGISEKYDEQYGKESDFDRLWREYEEKIQKKERGQNHNLKQDKLSL